jgi:hypothetical protein
MGLPYEPKPKGGVATAGGVPDRRDARRPEPDPDLQADRQAGHRGGRGVPGDALQQPRGRPGGASTPAGPAATWTPTGNVIPPDNFKVTDQFTGAAGLLEYYADRDTGGFGFPFFNLDPAGRQQDREQAEAVRRAGVRRGRGVRVLRRVRLRRDRLTPMTTTEPTPVRTFADMQRGNFFRRAVVAVGPRHGDDPEGQAGPLHPPRRRLRPPGAELLPEVREADGGDRAGAAVLRVPRVLPRLPVPRRVGRAARGRPCSSRPGCWPASRTGRSARRCASKPETIDWYEAVFFNVRDRLDNRDWITKQVLLPVDHAAARRQEEGGRAGAARRGRRGRGRGRRAAAGPRGVRAAVPGRVAEAVRVLRRDPHRRLHDQRVPVRARCWPARTT